MANKNKSPPSQESVLKQALCVVAYHIIAIQAIMPATQPFPVILSILFYPFIQTGILTTCRKGHEDENPCLSSVCYFG